jgi:hypothetical protein
VEAQIEAVLTSPKDGSKAPSHSPFAKNESTVGGPAEPSPLFDASIGALEFLDDDLEESLFSKKGDS